MKVTPITLLAAGLAFVALPATAQQRQPRPDREAATVEQLNEQSLARARAGQDRTGTSLPDGGLSGGGKGAAGQPAPAASDRVPDADRMGSGMAPSGAIR